MKKPLEEIILDQLLEDVLRVLTLVEYAEKQRNIEQFYFPISYSVN